MVSIVNRAKMTTATTGAGTITLGAASSGFQTFAAAGVSNNDTVSYVIEDGVAWEIGNGVYASSGTTLTRSLLSASTGNLLVLTGNAVVYIAVNAETMTDIYTKVVTGTFSSAVSDQIGNVRDLVNSGKSAAYIPTVADNGKMINITTGGVTINAGIFSAGQNITIYNNSASSQTITQGATVTLRLAGSATTGNRTLALRGIATVVCVASNEFVCSGAGLT